MSKYKQIVLLVIIIVVLAAAIVAMIPGESPLIKASLIVLSVIGALSALAQFTGTEALVESISNLFVKPRAVTLEHLLEYLIHQRLLVCCETTGRRPIYQLDHDYWTNLIIDFSELQSDEEAVRLCADYIRSLLPRELRHPYAIEPLDIGTPTTDARESIRKVWDTLKGRFIRSGEVCENRKAVMFLGTYSYDARTYLLREGQCVSHAIFLIGPNSDYLGARFKDASTQLVSIVSGDSLSKLSQKTLNLILRHNE